MANYKETKVKLTNTKLNKLKLVSKNMTWTTSRINQKIILLTIFQQIQKLVRHNFLKSFNQRDFLVLCEVD